MIQNSATHTAYLVKEAAERAYQHWADTGEGEPASLFAAVYETRAAFLLLNGHPSLANNVGFIPRQNQQ